MRLLELGCGNGDMWQEKDLIIETCDRLVLSDFSQTMVNSAKIKLKNYKNISFKVIDIQEIPFEDESFDIVIANMMLYHVQDINKAVSEVKRVLKGGGKFYSAINGENGIVKYISNNLSNFGVENTLNRNFTLQNGKEILLKTFEFI
ncbi:class I SAM-dependent methyltransferase [Facklamia sp. P12950]|uniref:class I SAM-dependent methyltransferase n=1 Tax=Facklamia sp. P12950 TaxID=3421951 RepID=UPI003D175B4F